MSSDFSLPEMTRRMTLMRALLREERADALVLAHSDDARWVSADAVGMLLLPAVGEPARVASGSDIGGRLRDLGLGDATIGLVADTAARDALAQELPGALVRDVTASFRARRAVRSEEEIAVMRRSAARADQAMASFASSGLASNEEFVETRIAATSMRAPRDVALDGSADAALPLERGDVAIVAIEAGPPGYRALLVRTLTVGDVATPEYARLGVDALATHRRAVATIRPGARIRELAPPVSLRDGALGAQAVLEAGMMVVVIADAASGDGRARVRVGDLHLVTGDGSEALQRHPLEIVRCR